MSTYTIYHNPNCSKSNKTLTILKEHNIQPTIIEYLKTPPSANTLQQLLQKLGKQPRDILREKLDPALTDQQVINAMVDNPKLIQRPIVVKDQQAIIGRPPENVLTLINQE